MVIVENAAARAKTRCCTSKENRRRDFLEGAVSDEAHIDDLLRAIPRIGLLEVVGAEDRGTLHHLVAAHDEVGPLTQSNLVAGIRAGAALRRR